MLSHRTWGNTVKCASLSGAVQCNLLDTVDIRLRFLSQMNAVYCSTSRATQLAEIALFVHMSGVTFLRHGSENEMLGVSLRESWRMLTSGGYAKHEENTSLKWNIFGDWIHHMPDGTRLWCSDSSDSIWPRAGYHAMLNTSTPLTFACLKRTCQNNPIDKALPPLCMLQERKCIFEHRQSWDINNIECLSEC